VPEFSRDRIEVPLDPTGGDQGADDDGFHQDLVDFGALFGDILIQEPVASGGDSTAWINDGDDDDDDQHPGPKGGTQ